MSKVVVSIGSPHKEGRTAQLVQEIVRGATEAGAEVKVYHASETEIGPCRGCWACAKAPEFECANKDGMEAVLAEVKGADAVVVGSPIYFFQASAQAKAFLDRLVPLYGLKITPEGPQRVPRFPVKKLLMAYTQNVDDPGAYKTYFDWARLGMAITPGFFDTMSDVVLSGCINPEPPRLAEAMETAYAAGRALA